MSERYEKIADALATLGRVRAVDVNSDSSVFGEASRLYGQVRDPNLRAGFVRYLDGRQDAETVRRGIGNLECG